MEYELELNKVLEEIEKTKAKRILIQLPDGLKRKAKEIYKALKRPDLEIFLWFGTCYGACDVPIEAIGRAKIDLIIQYGHQEGDGVAKWSLKDYD